jgi:protocatechuate 3,4-dioxygenase alpha subunit
MNLDRDKLRESPSQTAGPYVHIGCTPNFVGIGGIYPQDLGRTMVNARTKGERIVVTGIAYDGGGEPLRDALFEIWQADARGLYNSPSESRGKADPDFSGWGRQPADLKSGEFRFETIKPGPVKRGDGTIEAPHLTFWIAARGINIGLQTRMYFPDEAAANEMCPVLSAVMPARRRPTLIARSIEGGYRFDIRIQGGEETVFFDL